MPPTTPRCTQLDAAPHWRVVDFISDLHLQASEVATFDAWVRYLHNTPADAVFMLGDLFEVWVGDDAADEPGAFEARCAEVLRCAAQQRTLYFMHGNRDFLVGRRFLLQTSADESLEPVLALWRETVEKLEVSLEDTDKDKGVKVRLGRYQPSSPHT